ncbi:hypothetical protein IC582_020250 [Cucumis melo]|uniref:UPF0161 protein At3g09310 n=1 Tax=Cucumis melo TaxID=3656 RepID=A0A1S3BJN3_CUCME|nr:UPF0161 protein At3g09310 [Cucumis melo]XP_008448011.2 UPF0161 protein At3g09310 [Cucumis melo]
MAVLPTTNCNTPQNLNPIFFTGRCHQRPFFAAGFSIRFNCRKLRRPLILSQTRATSKSSANSDQDGEVDNLGVKAALSMLKFYKREISPLLPNSCRYLPTCSEYSMQAYKKYGVAKGTVLTAWRLCRCNPLGGSGFDPPRWFDEERLPEPED